MLTASMLTLAGCNQRSPEEQSRATVQNIKTHTLTKTYGDRCIAVLAAERESLDAISNATHINPSENAALRELTRRYTFIAIQSKIQSSYQGVVEY